MMRGARPMRSTRRLQNLTGALPKWWNIQNRADGPTVVSIYDEIGMMGVSAGEFLAELAGIDGDLDVHISSPGGDVFDAIAIHNMLKQRKDKVAVTIDGLAASAASFIAQAASPGMLEMAPHSTMMIHDGFAMGIGNSADMRELADQLDKASDNIASIYAARSGKPAAYWRAKMQATTWYSDEEAVADGLADRVTGQQNVKDTWDLTVFNVAPTGDEASEMDDKAVTAEPAVTAGLVSQIVNAGVDNSPWDAAKAWHNGSNSDDPEAFFKAICAGRKEGDPDTQGAYALPYRYTPDSPPNAAGVRNALARIDQTDGLTNKEEARSKLQGLMKEVNPDYAPDDLDTSTLSAMLLGALKGVST